MEQHAWLDRLRLRRGLTQEEVIRTAGIARSTWFDLRDGRTEPRLGTARRVAAALGVTVDEAWPPAVDEAA